MIIRNCPRNCPSRPRSMILDGTFWLVSPEPPIGIEPMTYSLRVNRSAD